MASIVLHTLGAACDFSHFSSFLLCNIESSVFGVLLERMRNPGGKALSRGIDMDDSMCVNIECAVTVLHLLIDGKAMERHDDSKKKKTIACLQEILSELIIRFDHSASTVEKDDNAILAFLQFFERSLTLCLGASKEARKETNSPCDANWFGLLCPYEKENIPLLSPCKGFLTYIKEKQIHDDQPIFPNQQTNNGSTAFLGLDTTSINQIAWRCGYLLSHPTLKVQLESCNVLILCFIYLGMVASDSRSSDEQNGPRTAIFRQIHSSWPAISARLRTSCSDCLMPEKFPLLLPDQLSADSHSDACEKRIFLSQLLCLVASIAECSDDFIASRFREHVWPCLCKIMEYFNNGSDRLCFSTVGSPKYQFPTSKKYSASDIQMLLAAIECISRIFAHEPTSKVLSDLLPRAGTYLLPLLHFGYENVEQRSFQAVKNILRSDYDCIWRTLVCLSGQKLPPNPLISANKIAAMPSESPAVSQELSEYAQLLIEYVDALAEQQLL
jgi:hypothetical protein